MKRRPGSALPAAVLAFILLGVLGAAYGPAIPRLRAEFSLTAAGAGTALTAHYLGTLAGIVLAGVFATGRWGGFVTQAAALSAGAGCAVIASSQSWPVFLLGAGLVGLGNGLAAARVNAWASSAFGGRSAAVVTLLNAAYGLGAILGPVVIAAAEPTAPGFRLPVAAAGAAILVLTPFLGAMTLPDHEPGLAGPAQSGPLLVAFAVLFLAYGGLETSSGAWIPTHARLWGGAAAAAAVAASFWAAMTAGRLLTAPLSLRAGVPGLVTASLAVAGLAYAAAGVPALVPAAYPVAGFGLAAVFPMGLVWCARLTGPRSIPLVMGFSAFGGAAFPPLAGLVIGAAGPAAVPQALLALCAACLLLAGAVLTWTRRAALAA
ncbi:MAG TPA: MFS transporter [Deinococcales bacterium]|nr:MFS transporter [Deinococcales bacterium]